MGTNAKPVASCGIVAGLGGCLFVLFAHQWIEAVWALNAAGWALVAVVGT